MGYLSNFNGEARGFDDLEKSEFFAFKLHKQTGYSFDTTCLETKCVFSLYDCKWYDSVSDLATISKVFPKVTIDVMVTGEEAGDLWKLRVRDGETEEVRANYVFPDFEKLKDDG